MNVLFFDRKTHAIIKKRDGERLLDRGGIMFEVGEIGNVARADYSDMFEAEFEKCRGIVYALRKRYDLNGYDEDDWLQEGRLIYWKSRESYDESRGITLIGFFAINLQRHIISILRSQMAMKRNSGLETISLDELIWRVGDAGIKPKFDKGEDGAEGVVLRDLLSDFSSMLSRFESVVWVNLLLGKSSEEISETVDLTVDQVNNAVDRVKRKIRVAL